MRHTKLFALIAVVVFALFVFLSGCGDTLPDGDNDDAFGTGDYADIPEDDVDGDDDEDFADEDMEPPLGANPALGYGPYKVRQLHIPIRDDVRPSSAYLFVPEMDDEDRKPLPTIVWGHGIWSSDWPFNQREMFVRMASRGLLIIYPNMDVPFPFMREDTVLKGVGTYLRAIRQAVRDGYADPEKIIFGGYSFGARVAALATAMTSGLDPLNIWPDPVACVYEALPDLNNQPTHPVNFPGPRPTEWAHLIDPSIPQTIMVAEHDMAVINFDPRTDEPVNGRAFYEALSTDYAQLIVIKSGAEFRDRARHSTFMAPTDKMLNALDLWGHIKIVSGMMQYHFQHRSKEWAYGFMRPVGGFDSAGNIIVHEVYERDLTDPNQGEQNLSGINDLGDEIK